MTGSTRVRLWIAAFAWVLVVGLAAIVLHPASGPLGGVGFNPFWTQPAVAPGTVAGPAALKAEAWLVCTLAPIALVWLVVRRRSR